MANKALDAKHEKILRALSKQPENKRCLNCESLGPGYVVTDLHIFVCTTCAGVHRNYGHRVKSISMASFTPAEVKSMQDGGNLVAEATYLARWTPHDLPKPVNRNESNIKKWISSVFVEKKYFSSVAEAERGEVAQHSNASSTQVTSRPLAQPQKSAAPSLIDFGDPTPVNQAGAASGPASTDNGWAAFAEAPQPAKAKANQSISVGAAPAAAPSVSDAWAAFESPSPAITQSTAKDSSGWATFQSAPQSTLQSNDGWAAFDANPGDASTQHSEVHAAHVDHRKELPSDLFSDPGQPAGFSGGFVAQQPSGYGASTMQYGGPAQPGMAPYPHAVGGHQGGIRPQPVTSSAMPPYVEPLQHQFMPQPHANMPPYGAPSYPGMMPGSGVQHQPSAFPPQSASGNPFGLSGSASPALAAVPSPVNSSQHGMGMPGAGMPNLNLHGSGGNPFSHVSHDASKLVAQTQEHDAFTDLLPSLGAALPTGTRGASQVTHSRAPVATTGIGHAQQVGSAPADMFSSFPGASGVSARMPNAATIVPHAPVGITADPFSAAGQFGSFSNGSMSSQFSSAAAPAPAGAPFGGHQTAHADQGFAAFDTFSGLGQHQPAGHSSLSGMGSAATGFGGAHLGFNGQMPFGSSATPQGFGADPGLGGKHIQAQGGNPFA